MEIDFGLLAMVQEVMCEIIADVAEDSSAEHRRRRVPIVEEDGMSKLPEWGRKDNKQCWRHNKSVSVHRKIMMDTVKEEVSCNADPVVWEVVVNVE